MLIHARDEATEDSAGPIQVGGRSGMRAADRGFTAAFELVMTPALFGLIGYFIDRQLQTGRIFTISLAAVVSLYVIWKLVYQYNTQMDQLQAELRKPDPSGKSSSSSNGSIAFGATVSSSIPTIRVTQISSTMTRWARRIHDDHPPRNSWS